jgi:hypothetical protein
MAGSNMYRTPWQVYAMPSNATYRAGGAGFIANVAPVDVQGAGRPGLHERGAMAQGAGGASLPHYSLGRRLRRRGRTCRRG